MSNVQVHWKERVGAWVIAAVVLALFVEAGVSCWFFNIKVAEMVDENTAQVRADKYAVAKDTLRAEVNMAYNVLERFYQRSQDMEALKQKKYKELKRIVKAVATQVQKIYQAEKGVLSEQELKNRLKKLVAAVRYDGTNYLWINDLHPTMIMHPIKPALNGRDLSNFTDKKGNKLFVKMAEVCKRHGEGMVVYYWPKPGETEAKLKISYVCLIPGLNWVIGSGAWVEDITAAMKKEALAQIARMRYGKKYFWINDMHPRMVMHPIKPALNGKDLSGYQDKRGTYLFKEMVRVCAAKGEGFVKYWWGKPGEQGEFPKLSFVKLFRPWGWVIGIGAYTDDIEASVAKTKSEFAARMRSLSIWVGVMAIVLAGAMVALLVTLIRKRVNGPLYGLMHFATQIASGNLAARPEGSFAGEFAVLKDAIVSMVDKLEAKIEEAENLSRQSKEEARKAQEAMIHAEEARKHAEARQTAMIEAASRLEKVVEKLISSSEQLAAQSEQALKGARTQRQRTEETATAMEEMTATVLEVAKNASTAAEETEEARTRAESGAQVVDEASKAIEMINELTDRLKQNMGSLKEKAGGISQVMTVISDIADQTNLLALNAAIEAARAGEAGRGFAVVADEVRKLAEKTMAATREVGDAISEIQSEVEKNVGEMNKVAGSVKKGTELAGESHKALQEIVKLVIDVTDQVRAIATASEEQSAASEEISRSVEDIKNISEETAKGMEETRSAIESLVHLAEELRALTEELAKG